MSLVLILLAMSIGLGSGYLYYRNDLYNTNDFSLNSQPEVATVKKINNDVRWKSAGSLAWLPLKLNSRIYPGDSLFSGERSNISVKFTNNNQINLQAETLLVINKVESDAKNKEDQIDVHLPYGQLELTSAGKTDWTIETKDQHLSLKSMNTPTNLQVEQRKDFKVVLKKGKAEVKHNGSNKILTADNQAFEIPSFPKLIPKTKIIELPSSEEFAGDESPDLRTNMVIQASEILPDLERSQNKKTPEIKRERPGPSKISLVRKNGKADEDSLYKEDRQKINSKYKPPELKAPFNNNSIYFHKGNELKLNFFWSRSNDVKTYILQVATNALFKTITLEKNQNQNSVDVVIPKDGKYHWRVKAICKDGESDWSEVHTFSVKYSN